MAKVIKTVVIVAAAVALVAFAAPIAGVVAGAMSITAAATIASIATVITSIGFTLGAAAIGGLFRKAPSIPNATVERLNSSVVPAAPRKIVFGETAAGNDIRFAETSGTKKDRYDSVVALASHRIHSVKSIHFENDLAWSGSIASKFSKGLVGVRHVLEGTASNAFAVGSGAYWNTTSKFTGCSYLALRYKLDGEAWPDGIPSRLTTIVEGCPLYDPRRDGTNGGSGSHRIADQSTWEFHNSQVAIGRNPALALLVYLLGYRINGKLVWGMGVPVSRINLDSFRAYANLCEERVSLQAGGTVQRYTCDGILSTADSHEACIGAITAAMGSCKLVDAGGQYSIIGGYDDTLGLKVHFTADDLVAPAGSTNPYVWVPAPPTRETFNMAKGRFADPASLYQLVDWGTIETETLDDGIQRPMTVDLSMVSRPETCQRIASQFLLREAKTPGIFTAVFGPRAFAAQVGSLVTLSLPAQAWNRKLFRVLDQAESHDLVFQMTLREESSEVYAWDREEKPLPANIRPEGYDPTDVLSVEGLAATTTTSVGASSYETSDVSVTWTAQDSGRVAGIQIEARPTGMSVWSEIAALHNAAAGALDFQSVRPGAQIEIRARYRMSSGVFGPWATVTIYSAPAKVDWQDAISGDGKPDDGATVGAPIGTEVGGRPAEDIVREIAELSIAKVDVSQNLEYIQTAILSAQLLEQRRKARTDVLTHLDGKPVATAISRVDRERIEGDTALAETISLLGAKSGDSLAFVLDSSTVQVEPGKSLATRFAELSAEVGTEESLRQAAVTRLDKADADEAIVRALAVSQVQAEVATERGVRTADVTRLDTAVAAEGEARADAITQVTASLASERSARQADVVRLDQSIADETSARAQAMSQVEAQVATERGARTADVTRLDTAVATEGEARADAITQVRGELATERGGRVADVSRLDQSIADEAGARAEAVTQVRAEVATERGARAADVSRLDTAIATESEARSQSLTNVTTTVADHTSSIGLLLRSVNGQEATAQLVLNSNGKVSGFRVNGQTQSFAVDARNFRLTDPATGIDYFFADATGAKMHNVEVDRIKANSIDSPALQQAAVSKTSFLSLTSDVACPQGSPTTVVSYTFVKEDADSILKIQMFAQCYHADDLDFWGDIVVDGVARQRAQVRMPFDNSGSRGQAPITPTVFIPSVGAGEHSVAFVLTSNETEGPTYVRAGSTLEVTELRRGAIGNASGTAAPIDTGGSGSGSGSGGGDYGGGEGGGGYEPPNVLQS